MNGINLLVDSGGRARSWRNDKHVLSWDSYGVFTICLMRFSTFVCWSKVLELHVHDGFISGNIHIRLLNKYDW